MPSKSKQKGSGFEREVAKFLSELYQESFIRVPGSGAYTGGSNTVRKSVLHDGQIRNFKGDIVPGQSFPNLNCEAKFYADFSFHLLWTESKQLDDWLDQLMTASDPGDLNILFMKFNRRGRWVVVQSLDEWNTQANIMFYRSKKYGRWMIYSFEEFFAINADVLRKLCSKRTLTESTHHG
jgi:hypothetical protein